MNRHLNGSAELRSRDDEEELVNLIVGEIVVHTFSMMWTPF
jgi:hypothetical protein